MNILTFNKESIEANHNVKAQWEEVKQGRKVYETAQNNLVDQFGSSLNAESFAKNSAGILTRDFYREVDNTITEVRDNDQGREFVTDLMSIATPLPIGKTVRLYTNGGDINDVVARSMDGNTPNIFDYLETDNDGDPVPIFTGGVGINWRHWSGLETENIDLVTQSQRRKLVKVYSNIADYFLNGDSEIKVNGYEGQGIKNHRHTKKVNLGASGSNINLTTATADEIIKFFSDDFATELDANYVDMVDKMWVSPEIARRLAEPYSKSGDFKEGTLGDYVLRYGRVGEFKRTFKMSGNEFFAYVKNKETITPLVGAAVSMIPVPRTMPMDNYNFLIWAAVGLQIKGDANGRGGVFYAADLG